VHVLDGVREGHHDGEQDDQLAQHDGAAGHEQRPVPRRLRGAPVGNAPLLCCIEKVPNYPKIDSQRENFYTVIKIMDIIFVTNVST